jgi:Fic family protein
VSTEPLARLILRAEALASSKIEGLQMSAGKLLEYEALDDLGIHHRIDGTEAAVIGNITSMESSIDEFAAKKTIAVEDICTMNRRLLEHTDEAAIGGVIRTQQNWIGGNNVNPIGAAFVPPPPEIVPDLMADLVRFMNEAVLPPVALAALAHAQLETIHPFADGNGRTGRTLVHVLLRKAGVTATVIPPVSLVLATDKSRYINNLTAFRTNDAEERVTRTIAESDWVEYFSQAVSTSCAEAASFNNRLEDILANWREHVHPRAHSAASRLLPRLLDNPVVSVKSAARLTGRSDEAARQALLSLRDAGILQQNAHNRKSNLFVATDVLDAFTIYERQLASPIGDTSIEKPARPAPQPPRRS